MDNTNIPTTQVKAKLFAVVLGGTESLLKVELGNGYKFEKINIVDSPFKYKYLNAQGYANGKYCFCQIPPISDKEINFICLVKEDEIPCSVSAFTIGQMQSQEIFISTMEIWQKNQEDYIRKILRCFRIFKDGNIEIPSTCYSYIGEYLINQQNYNTEVQHIDAGDVINDFYILTDTQIIELNKIITNNTYKTELLVNTIDKFELGCKTFRDEIAFKELITVGEVLFLNYKSNDNDAKKEKLSNRLAVWIAVIPSEVQSIHDDIISFYKYRSNDTHEADNTDITLDNRKKLREYMRKALKKYIDRINQERNSNPSMSFENIRRIIVSEIITTVTNYKSTGILL